VRLVGRSAAQLQGLALVALPFVALMSPPRRPEG